VECLLSAHKWSIRGDEHVKTWVWNENGWEIVDINIKTSIETERCGQGGNNLCNQSVEVGVRWTFDIKGSTAYVVKSFVIKVEGKVRVLKEGVGGEHSVVWFYNSSGNLRRWSDGETHLGLSGEVYSKTFEKEGSKTGPGSSSGGVEDEESLKSGTVVTHLADLVHYVVNDILSNGVVTTCVVVSSVFLPIDDGFRVVKRSVVSGADGVTHGWFEIDHNCARDVLSVLGFGEEGVECTIFNSNGLVRWHSSFLGDAVFKAVKLPAGVTYCKTGLSDVKRE
jgi:hypothetical protein